MNRVTLVGGRPVSGKVAVRGAKNSISKQLVAALLTDRPAVLHNVPAIADTFIVSDMLRAMGVDVDCDDDGAGSVSVHARDVKPLPYARLQEFSGKSRIPILLCGPLIVRTGRPSSPASAATRSAPGPSTTT